MFKNFKTKFVIIRNVVLAELISYGFFVLLAEYFYWAKLYRTYLPWLAPIIPFNAVELGILGIYQIALVTVIVINTAREEASVHDLVRKGEHERLEFKTTMRWDMKRGQVSKDLERAIMKTIAAFLNSDGGTLLIGIDDQRQPVGLKHDVNSLVKKNHDGFENHFNNVFSAMIGPEYRRYVKLSFHDYHGEDVCLVAVARAKQPAYVKTENGEDFFIRTGNATTPLKMSQVAAYLATWSER